MRKIGIVDYFIDEYHSNKYLELFKKANEELGFDFVIAYAYAEIDKEGRRSTEQWCKDTGVTRCMSIDELCEKSDNILILAPANPETHLRYAEQVLKYGKNTYIDKTFAPDFKTAKKIFDIANSYNTKIFSTSALRYAEELEGYNNVKSLIVTGAGSSLEEYIIHQIEIAVSIVGTNVTDVKVFNRGRQATVLIDFSGVLVTLNYAHSECLFSVDADIPGERLCKYKRMESDNYFYTLSREILKFFCSSVLPFKNEETLCVMAIRDAIIEGMHKKQGVSIAVADFNGVR